jgi:hypothetical protein
MGFFAKQCAVCGESVVSIHKVRDERANLWEACCIAYHPEGGTTSGVYDGYGRINGQDIMGDWDNLKLVHVKCHTPKMAYSELGESHDCPNQGFFDGEDA